MAAHTELTIQVDSLLETAIRAGRFSGAACTVMIGGEVVIDSVYGAEALWRADLEPIPAEDREPVTRSTFFDLASLTKIFTAHTVLQLIQSGVGSLDDPLAEVLPSYRGAGRRRVTLRHLLSHTSGLPATWSGWRGRLADELGRERAPMLFEGPLRHRRRELVADLLETPLTAAPGERFEYSCTNYNTAMAYMEAATGQPWSRLQRQWTIDALELTQVTDAPEVGTTAATEYQPELRRGVIRGQVHDETAWVLGGGAGNAGLFATARSLAQFGEAIRLGGDSVRDELMWSDALSATLGRATTQPSGGFGSALGLRIGDAAFMGPGASDARGHTGFTGTSLVVDRGNACTIVLLTNRVHPSRDGDGLQQLRADLTSMVLREARGV